MAPPARQERYNAKARGSVAGGSHKKRKRPHAKLPKDGDGDDVEIESVHDIEADDGRGSMSSKKRKRLDSYIAKKLKSEQRLKTIQLLASLAPSRDTSSNLVSTSSLGQNPTTGTTAKERLEIAEDRMVRRGIEKLRHRQGSADSENDGLSSGSEMDRKGKGRVIEVVRDVDEEEGVATTVLPTKKEVKEAARVNGKLPKKKSNWNPNLLSTQPESDTDSSFDSSDSGYESGDVPVAGPSSPKLPSPPSPPPSVKTAAKLATPIVVARVSVPTVSVPTSLGGALKAGAAPRVEKRRIKMPLGRFSRGRLAASRDDNEEEDEDEDEDEIEDEDDDENSDAEEDEDEAEDEDEDSEDADSEEDHSGSEGASDSQHSDTSPPPKKRASDFKSWALKQMGQVKPPSAPDLLGDRPTEAEKQTARVSKSAPNAHEGPAIGPLGSNLLIPSSSLLDQKTSTARPKLNRRASISEARMDLPILAEEQSIVEAIIMHPVVVIAGETGSGKTTQVPQMLYEAGFGFKGSDNPGMIAVTQPRRVAAVSLAARVKSELNIGPHSSVVAHQIRYSSTSSPDTAIKFMTDGVLLRELASDFLLSRYSVVVVDEAHERGVNTDVLIGVLSRVAKLRERMWRDCKDDTKPLRIVIMSATLRIEDFAQNSSLFPVPPPVIHIPARQHPVTTHFSRKTVGDYVTEAYKKVCKIHARLPPGGVLVFLTGQSEIQALCRKLEKKYGKGRKREETAIDGTRPPEDQEAEEVELGQQDDLAADVDDGDAESDPEALDSDDDGMPELELEESTTPMHVLPLYSLLPNDQQMLVFKPPPADHRLVIIATNVAETSLTIPGIRYVVDSGRAKERQYDAASGVQSFTVSWISKASASQRAGRAGRTGPGHCYRLYSSALYEDHFEKFAKPEILRMPIEGVVLQMKSMNIDQVVNFPFPTPPDRGALKKAEDLLTALGALAMPTNTRMINGVQHAGSVGGQITDLGKSMAGFPVSPRFAKMLAIGSQHGCLPYVVALVAGLSVGDPFVHEQSLELGDEDDLDGEKQSEIGHIRSEEVREKEERKEVRRRYFKAHSQFAALGGGISDAFKLLAAVGAYEYDPTPSFCSRNFLRSKAMQEIQQLRSQLCNIAKLPHGRLSPPSDTQLKVIRQILTAGFIDQIAVRSDVFNKSSKSFTSSRNVAYRAVGLGDEQVYIHPTCVLFHRAPPEFLTFQDIVRTRRTDGNSKVWIKGVTLINPAWLSSLGKALCSFSRPTEVHAKGRGKREQVKEGEREVVVVPHFKGLGVDLPGVRKVQRREGTRWVLVE
ncbi:P-loop containing nucleoside triphosphate hydrolase protein [Naematelia encephala]|uniref:RNA helicase n=1 Tax=Naematelia encephala TaxID=71784 RepID=A0A1Y2BC93_9TREE|nr:P-loop containing nucleoside triphosphate hydrolase protein [Naematelia encephala]